LKIKDKYFYTMMIAILVTGLIIGYNWNDDREFVCHINSEDLNVMFAKMGNVNESKVYQQLSHSLTLGQVKDIYDKYQPMSNGVLEYEVTKLCRS